MKQAFQTHQISTKKATAQSYNVARTTLRGQINGKLLKAESNTKKRKLLPTKETTLEEWRLDLD
jgi:hypothetical protein